MILNHQNCKCTFVSHHEVIYKDKQLPAQQWESPGGDRYFRVFYDKDNPKNYMRCQRKQLIIID